jgi:hypothetical protein
MDDIDIWRTANEMMKLYGEEAEFKAALRADKLLELGDADGFHVWKRVVQAIVNLTKQLPDKQTVH